MDHPKLPTSLELTCTPSFRLAYRDPDLMEQPEMRSVRLQLESIKPQLGMEKANIDSTIVVFGGARISEPAEAKHHVEVARILLSESPDDERRRQKLEQAKKLQELSSYYDMAREFSRLVAEECKNDRRKDYVIITGGGPGIMEAANRGAWDAGTPSIGLNIKLPREQQPNRYISPDLCFQFHYFAMRKMHFLMKAKALVVFPGGFGTFDELFEALTLRQTGRMQRIPIILFGMKTYWNTVLNFERMAEWGLIDTADLDLFYSVDTPQQAWDYIKRFHATEE